MGTIKLLHTADVHLGAPFGWLGAKGKEQRSQLRETFRAIVDLALSEKVDAFLVAGDLFDSNAPSQDTIDLVQSQLRRLDIPVFLLPGTHDCLDGSSIYRKEDFTSKVGTHVHVFDHSQTAFEISAIDLTVHGRANTTKTSTTSPLNGIKKSSNTRFNVALAHGSLAMPGTEDDFPFTRVEIGASGMDYVALGHWHTHQDCTALSTRACYCGPPELLGDGNVGCVMLVELAETETRVEQRRVGRRRSEKLELDLTGSCSLEEVQGRIRDLRDSDLVLSVVLDGVRPLELIIKLEDLMAELGDNFFALRVDDRSHPALRPDDLASFSEKVVIGQFVRRMKEELDQASSQQERRVRETALQLGVALLQGRKVL